MEMFIRLALQTALDSVDTNPEEDEYIVDYSMLDRFINMIIGCSFNWLPSPSAKALNVIDEAQALNIIWEVMDEYHIERLNEFDQIPFKRILNAFLKHFAGLFSDKGPVDIEKVQKKNEILLMFSNLFKKMNPRNFPAFAFAWLEIISSSNFMPMMLSNQQDYNTQEKRFKMQELFNELFSFLKENIYENSPSSPALEKFFEGTLKLCLVVLHDYPEFFCFYYFEFINHLPLYKTGNLRNMILAAYPKDMRLPDPGAEVASLKDDSDRFGVQDRQTLLQNYVDESNYYTLKNYLDKSNDEANLINICKILEESQVVKSNRRIINTGIVHATMIYMTEEIYEKKTVEELEDMVLINKFEVM